MKSKQEIQALAEQEYFDTGSTSRLMVIGFIDGYETAQKQLPTWDDVRKAMILARKNQQFPFSFPKSDDEIIEQLKHK